MPRNSENQSDSFKNLRDLLFTLPSEAPAESNAREDQLSARRAMLKEQRRRFEQRAFAVSAIGTTVVLLGTPIVGFLLHSLTMAAFIAAYGLAFVLLGLLQRTQARATSEEIQDISNELDLLELVRDERERRATKLLQVNQSDLKRYYEQTLRQGNQIFYAGFVCILFGFAVIGAAFWLIQGDDLPNLSDKIVVAALGAVGGVLANFIAAIYLKMFSETTDSVSKFHRRLVVRDRLNFANVLAAKIETETAREKALARMAVELASDGELAGVAQSSASGSNGTSP
jgi:hypothetical protein